MRKILLVEDEDILRDTYVTILSTQPYLLDVAENGKVALDLCQKSSYDLILLDLMMPVMDGVTFLEHFTKDDSGTSKVLIMSNLSSGTELERAMALGSYRNMVKAELTPRQLLALVRYELDGE